MGVSNMSEINDEMSLEQLNRVRHRMEALDKIEAKLRQMRELATYAVSRTLSKKEVAQVQEWVDILRAEVEAIDKSTTLGDPVLTDFVSWKPDAKRSIH